MVFKQNDICGRIQTMEIKDKEIGIQCLLRLVVIIAD